ncbi:hypothetical protein [Amycolatopsis sp. BJA-103]|uniref:hypothetical protein n=1 Tax=Amycolatopsis sp. BJA-103 TaxID=1911175 RepID=UPI000CA1C69A|nr:hypothetical protein [Amycolatopsis sp. BJA-103]AUI58418.1 hypothetical protein BKN51_09455 [Amycolatopsis sp. BJA-103]PNE15096.1 hypothetical protein B1H26_31430 [Amycolatopsis sp. BJA-103]
MLAALLARLAGSGEVIITPAATRSSDAAGVIRFDFRSFTEETALHHRKRRNPAVRKAESIRLGIPPGRSAAVQFV